MLLSTADTTRYYVLTYIFTSSFVGFWNISNGTSRAQILSKQTGISESPRSAWLVLQNAGRRKRERVGACGRRQFRRRWSWCGPGWSATRSAPRTPPAPPGTEREWSRERRSAAPLRPCGSRRRGLPHPLWWAHAPARRWRLPDAASYRARGFRC